MTSREEETERLERIMAEADERTREVLQRYGGLHAVTFGHCGCSAGFLTL